MGIGVFTLEILWHQENIDEATWLLHNLLKRTVFLSFNGQIIELKLLDSDT